MLALAALAAGAYAVFRVPLRVQWLVARGAPPAEEDVAAECADAVRALGPAARGPLLAIVRSRGASFDRRAWSAALLLRAPFLAQAELERTLADGPPPAARAAAFALLGGDRPERFEATLAGVLQGRAGLAPRPAAPPVWDPAPALPVLIAWVGDEADPSAAVAARLLGTIPPGRPEVAEALLAAVERAPALLRAGPVTREVGERKLVAVAAIQSLLRWAPGHPDVVRRVSRVIAALADADTEDRGWDIQRYALDLLVASGGRGMDFDAVLPLADGPNRILRQKLAGVLGEIRGPVGEVLRRLSRDESPLVRRNAVASMALRKDRDLFREIPYIVEDSYIFLRSDALRHLGDLMGVDPEASRALVPLLVACLADPWPGDPIPTFATMHDGGTLEVMSQAMLALRRITGLQPGFSSDPKVGDAEVADPRRREAVAARMLAEPAFREEVLGQWRAVTTIRPDADRLPFLVEHLSDRDPENVLRAMRELHRLMGRSDGFPAAVLRQTGDDTAARDAIREWARAGREATVSAWKDLIAPR